MSERPTDVAAEERGNVFEDLARETKVSKMLAVLVREAGTLKDLEGAAPSAFHDAFWETITRGAGITEPSDATKTLFLMRLRGK